MINLDQKIVNDFYMLLYTKIMVEIDSWRSKRKRKAIGDASVLMIDLEKKDKIIKVNYNYHMTQLRNGCLYIDGLPTTKKFTFINNKDRDLHYDYFVKRMRILFGNGSEDGSLWIFMNGDNCTLDALEKYDDFLKYYAKDAETPEFDENHNEK